jgi:hypothetical protein
MKIIVILKNAVFWDVAPCIYCINWRFGGTYHLHLQSTKIHERGTSVSRWLQQVNNFHVICESWDNTVGIATSYWLDDRRVGVRVLVGSRIFSSVCRSDRLWDPLNLLSNGYRGLFPRGVKRPGREADHSPPTSAEVKKTCKPSWRSA